MCIRDSIHINAQNSKGQTALHMCISSDHCRKPGNMIKRLMVKGADLSIKDNKGRTAMDLCLKQMDKRPDTMKEVLKVLERASHEKKSCSQKLKEALMISQPLTKQVKSPRLMFFYIGLVAFIQIVICLTCFPFFTIESLKWLKTLTMFSLAMLVVMGFITWARGPGFIEHDPEYSMLELLQRFEVNELCYECQIVALPRSYHCNVCKVCVQRYDHHCPWLNSCIGTRNHRPFIFFVTFQFVYLVSVLIQIIGFFVTYSRRTSNLEFFDDNGQLLNTCLSEETRHFADWCTASMQPGPDNEGFFLSLIHI